EVGARCREAAALARGAREPAGAGPSDEPTEPFDLHLALWEAALAGGRPLADVEAAVGIFGERASRRGSPRPLAVARAVEGALALQRGRLEDAEAALRAAAALAREAGFALGEAFALERLGVLLTARGRLDEGLEALGAGMLVAERAVLRRHALTRVHVALTRNRLAAGAVYAAEDFARESSETAARQGECAVCDALLRPELVRVALARGKVDEAEREAADLEALAARRAAPALAAAARAARGRVLGARGKTGEAVASLQEARQAFPRPGAGVPGRPGPAGAGPPPGPRRPGLGRRGGAHRRRGRRRPFGHRGGGRGRVTARAASHDPASPGGRARHRRLPQPPPEAPEAAPRRGAPNSRRRTRAEAGAREAPDQARLSPSRLEPSGRRRPGGFVAARTRAGGQARPLRGGSRQPIAAMKPGVQMRRDGWRPPVPSPCLATGRRGRWSGRASLRPPRRPRCRGTWSRTRGRRSSG
ncbi:MAG TPA: hypothetical protein VIV59_09215, partial [Anaeromyxobacteraceae bacterium]